VLFVAFLALSASLESPAVRALDARVSAAIQAWRGPALTTVVLLLYRRRWSAVVLVLGVLVPSTYAFPSGHSITAMLLYGVLGFLLWRGLRVRWRRMLAVAICAVLVLAIGLSRIYLGVHWPTDVVASILLGGVWLSLLAGAYLSWERRAAIAG